MFWGAIYLHHFKNLKGKFFVALSVMVVVGWLSKA